MNRCAQQPCQIACAAQPRCSLSNSALCGLQVTHLKVCIRRKLPETRYTETDMVVLACVVVACSARLEVLDLSLGDWSDSSSDKPYAQSLLVGLVSASASHYAPEVGPAERGSELLKYSLDFVLNLAVCGGAVRAAAVAPFWNPGKLPAVAWTDHICTMDIKMAGEGHMGGQTPGRNRHVRPLAHGRGEKVSCKRALCQCGLK